MDLRCRICFMSDKTENFIKPCLCSGSASHVHRYCLDQWRQSSFSAESLTKCPTCKFEYTTKNNTDKYALQKTIFWSLARKLSLMALLFLSSLSISPILGNWALCSFDLKNESESDSLQGWVCLEYFPSTEQDVWKLFYRGVYTSFVLLGLYTGALGMYLWITGKYFNDFFDFLDHSDTHITQIANHNIQNEVINNDTHKSSSRAKGTHLFSMGCFWFSDFFCGKYGSGTTGGNYTQILCTVLLILGIALVFVVIFKCIYFTFIHENRKWRKEITKIYPVVCLNTGSTCEKIMQQA